MNPQNSARYALPFSSRSHFGYVKGQMDKQEADQAASGQAQAAPALQERQSAGGKLARKMQSLFVSKKEQKLAREDNQAANKADERKKAMQRRLVGNDGMLLAGRARLGRP